MLVRVLGPAEATVGFNTQGLDQGTRLNDRKKGGSGAGRAQPRRGEGSGREPTCARLLCSYGRFCQGALQPRSAVPRVLCPQEPVCIVSQLAGGKEASVVSGGLQGKAAGGLGQSCWNRTVRRVPTISNE